MKKTLVLTLVLALVGTLACAHDQEDHTHKAPHGGIVRTAGKYHVEVVPKGTSFDVYLLDDHEATLPIRSVTVKVTGLTKDKKKLDIQPKPIEDHFTAAVPAGSLAGATLVVTMRRGEETISARFALK
ncbi:MAG TPA: hypothetical protein VMW27_00855 [Thermoanaerobaculia bacterium]|nr:hypothetical protein [Thermoanaerobaculia bacterium]